MLQRLGLLYDAWGAWIVRLHNGMWLNRRDARTASRFGCRNVMRFIVAKGTRTVGNAVGNAVRNSARDVGLDDSVRRGEFCGDFCGFDRGRSIRYATQLPIDIWIDSFEPGHSENHLVAAKGSDKESFFVENASNRKLANDNAIRMN